MKIKVAIYNDDSTRDIQVIELAVDHSPRRTVIPPETEGKADNMSVFEIIRGDMLVVTATGD